MDKIHKILEYAVWAPSGDNSQPWEFVVDENALHIYNLPDRDNPFLNFNQSGSYLAHGALIENIVVTASHFGLKTAINLFPEMGAPTKVATIFFESERKIIPDPLFDYILSRHTNRKPYFDKSLTVYQKEKLLNSIKAPASLYLVEDREDKLALGAAGSEAEVVILENKKLHSYLFSDVVWSESEELRRHQGLYIQSMEFNPVQRIMFRLASFWSFMRIAIILGLPRFIAMQDATLYASGSALGLITMPDESKESTILAGRATQRAWLTATSLGLSFHPVSATLFFAKRVEHNDAELISPLHQKMMLDAYNTIKKTFSLPVNQVPYMMFRIGKSKPATARTTRHSINEKIRKV